MLFSSLSKDQICILLCSSKIYSLKRQIKGLWIRGYEAHLGAEYQPDKKWRLNEYMHMPDFPFESFRMLRARCVPSRQEIELALRNLTSPKENI